jgi:hypothetical protein
MVLAQYENMEFRDNAVIDNYTVNEGWGSVHGDDKESRAKSGIHVI